MNNKFVRWFGRKSKIQKFTVWSTIHLRLARGSWGGRGNQMSTKFLQISKRRSRMPTIVVACSTTRNCTKAKAYRATTHLATTTWPCSALTTRLEKANTKSNRGFSRPSASELWRMSANHRLKLILGRDLAPYPSSKTSRITKIPWKPTKSALW